MQTLLDTHAWLWWVTSDARLSKKAKAQIEKARQEEDLYLSMISIWELAKKVEKKQLILDRGLDAWLDLATATSAPQFVDLTRPILVESCRLP